MQRTLLLLCAALICACQSLDVDDGPADATDPSFRISSVELDGLLSNARDAIAVEGIVASTACRWGTNGHGDELIYTDVDFDVDKVLLGDAPAGSLRFRREGGTMGDTSLFVSHTPEMTAGERAIVLVAPADGGLQLVGHDYAKIPIARSLLLDGDPIAPETLRARFLRAELSRGGSR
jgi:hypothetical protein